MGAQVFHDEAGFKAIFDHAPVGILVVGQDRKVRRLNKMAADLFGYSEEEILNQPVTMLLPGPLSDQHEKHEKEYFKNPSPRPMGTGRDLSGRRKGGYIFPVEVSLGHYAENGEQLAVVFVGDITERTESQEKLNQLNAQFEVIVENRTHMLSDALEREQELNELKSRFISTASHELRTPLAAILSSVNLIERYTTEEESEKRSKHTDRIKEQVRHLTSILNDILALDRLERGRIAESDISQSRERFAVEKFIGAIVENFHGIRKKGQEITYDHDGEEHDVLLDKKIIAGILNNLVSNAIKYSPENTTIEVYSKVSARMMTLRVTDHGYGIPDEEQPKLFSQFFRASNAQNEPGTGLGLSIVKKYVELLEGDITFESSFGEGTTFEVRIPLPE